jgi:hypothetical protein
LTAFKWSERRERGAILLAADQLTDEQIATEVGISRAAFAKWKNNPEFRARVQELIAAALKKVADKGIREKANRIAWLDDREQRMQTVIRERSEDPTWREVPGWGTGLLVHRQRQIGGGRDAQIVDEFEVDTGLLSEMRATEQQAAKELGQWVEKAEQSGEVLVRIYERGIVDRDA